MYELLVSVCETEDDLKFIWDSLTREHVVVLDAGQRS